MVEFSSEKSDLGFSLVVERLLLILCLIVSNMLKFSVILLLIFNSLYISKILFSISKSTNAFSYNYPQQTHNPLHFCGIKNNGLPFISTFLSGSKYVYYLFHIFTHSYTFWYFCFIFFFIYFFWYLMFLNFYYHYS